MSGNKCPVTPANGLLDCAGGINDATTAAAAAAADVILSGA